VSTEGFVDFRGYKTWYHVEGDLSWPQTPLLLLHGGPGGTSDLFEPLDELASSGRPIVRYDQLGCGRSERPSDPSLWTIETYVDELAAVRSQLGLDRVHLLGHSWGGMLALEYLFTKPAGIKSLTLASSLSSTKRWTEEAERLRSDMPNHLVAAMRRCEASHHPKALTFKAGSKPGMDSATITKRAKSFARILPLVGSSVAGRLASLASRVPPLRGAAYEVLGGQFGKLHGCRADPMPLALLQMFVGMNRDIYQHMWGPSEFYATGTIKDWDVTSRLHEIGVPTLITSGRYDESTPAQNEILRDGIAGSEWIVFEDSAHCAPVEEPQAFRETVERFVSRHDG
jgi:pimeloyl-ACP methyl ester carboxylesterase